MQVQLGNAAAKDAYRDVDGNLLYRALPGKQITTVHIPDDYSLFEGLQCITAGDGVWANHSISEDPAVPAVPSWVESDSPALAAVLAENYNCPIGRPGDWDEEGGDA